MGNATLSIHCALARSPRKISTDIGEERNPAKQGLKLLGTDAKKWVFPSWILIAVTHSLTRDFLGKIKTDSPCLFFKVAKSAILGEGQKRIQNSGKSAFPSTFLHLSIRFKWTRRNVPIKWRSTKLPCDDCFSKKQLCHDSFPPK